MLPLSINSLHFHRSLRCSKAIFLVFLFNIDPDVRFSCENIDKSRIKVFVNTTFPYNILMRRTSQGAQAHKRNPQKSNRKYRNSDTSACFRSISAATACLLVGSCRFAVARNFSVFPMIFYPLYKSTNRTEYSYTVVPRYPLGSSMLHFIGWRHDHDDSRFNEVRKLRKSFEAKNSRFDFARMAPVQMN